MGTPHARGVYSDSTNHNPVFLLHIYCTVLKIEWNLKEGPVIKMTVIYKGLLAFTLHE